jgi:hypothetical protein
MSFRWYYPDQVQRCFSDRVMPKQLSNTRHAVTKTYVVQLFPDPKDQILYYCPPPYRPQHPRNITNSTRSLFFIFFLDCRVIKLDSDGRGGSRWAVFVTIVGFDFAISRAGFQVLQIVEPNSV